jgi:hypothetical protein
VGEPPLLSDDELKAILPHVFNNGMSPAEIRARSPEAFESIQRNALAIKEMREKAKAHPVSTRSKVNYTVPVVLGLFLTCTVCSKATQGCNDSRKAESTTERAVTRDPTSHEILTADYEGLAKRACSAGWDRIIQKGGVGVFDHDKFSANCVRRLTQVGKDCGRIKHTVGEVSDCIREATPTVANAILLESQ